MRIAPQIPPGIVSDDTSAAAAGRWADGDNMRPHNGRMQTVGGWESVVGQLLGGVCRAAFAWTDNDAILNLGFGTHATLEVYVGGGLHDVTPLLARPSATLPLDPLAVTDALAEVTVTHLGHGLADGDSITVSGAAAVGRITPNGNFAVTVVDKDHYKYVFSSPADIAETLGTNPLAVTSGSAIVTVTDAAHGIPDGTEVTISGAAAVGGITPNGTFPITVIGANSYSYVFTATASSTVAAGGGAAVVATVPTTGGGSAVVVAPQVPFAAGEIDGTGSAGYGTGAYGVGDYGLPSEADYFPRTWSLGAWGENLLANPRGGTIYEWTNDVAQRAKPLAEAPRQVTHLLVASANANYWAFALGCNEEVSGAFNPLCIRHSGLRDNISWTTGPGTTAREYILTGGGRIVAGRIMGSYILVWTTHALFLGQFVGSPEQPWRFDMVGEHCGLAGPGAAVVNGQRAFWVTPDRQFMGYALGAGVEPVACPIREDFADNLAAAQADKIVASSIAEYSEVRFDYPDARDAGGLENSRYVALKVAGPDAGAWHRGRMARTAMIDAGPSQHPVGVRPVVTEGEPIIVAADGAVFGLTATAALDLGAAAGADKWTGRYIQRIEGGVLPLSLISGSLETPYSYSRTGAATALTAAGAVQVFAADALRITDRGVLIEAAATNLFTHSEDFTNAAVWPPIGLGVTANAGIAPDGSASADLLDDADISTADVQISRTMTVEDDDTAYTLSLFLKRGTATSTRVDFAIWGGGGSVGSSNVITWANGTVARNGAGPGSTELTPLGNGWHRLSISLVNNAMGNTTLGLSIRPAGVAGATGQPNLTGSAYVWGAQLETGLAATSYIPTTDAAATRGADALTVTPASVIYWHELGQTADGAPLSAFVESADLALDDDYAVTVRQIRPDFKDQVGAVSLTLTSRFEPQGEERTVVAAPMAPGDDKADVRATGRLFRVKFAVNSAPAALRLGRVIFDVARAGMR